MRVFLLLFVYLFVVFLNLESSVLNYLRTHLHFLKLDRNEEHDLLLALLTVLKGKTTEREILQDVHSVGPSVVLSVVYEPVSF